MPTSRIETTSRAETAATHRFEFALAAGIFALCTLTLAYPALAGQFLINPFSDQYIAGYPFREFAAEMLREQGRFPLWNPYLFGGLPYVAAMHGDIFYPTFLLRLVFETDTAMTLGFVIHLFLAGLFTFGFLRAARIEFPAAVVGGIAYMMSGPIASYASPGHDGKLFVSTLLPLTLWLLIRGIRDGRWWSWGALALTVGLAVVSPHPQLLQYMLLAGGAFALFVALGGLPGAPPRPVAIRRLALALGGVVLGGAMGAIQYLPVAEYVEWSPRAGGMASYEAATSYSMPPEELINTYLPHFSGILDAYWGRNGIHFHSEYLGAAVLVIAGAAFFGSTRRRFLWFWVGALVVSLLWALGGFTPFYRLVYAIVPGTKFFRAPSTILFVVAFSVAVLAALGVERLRAGTVSARYVIGWGVGALLMALLATAGGLTNLATTIAVEARYDAVVANQGAVALGGWRSLLFVVLAATLVLLRLRGALPLNAAIWGMGIVIAIDLWSIERHYWRFLPPAEVTYASDPTIEYVRNQPEPGRVLALQTAPTQALNDPFLNFDALMVHDVRLAMGYHGNELGRYQRLYGKADGVSNIGNPNFWRLSNLRYLLIDAAEPPIEGLERLAGPVRNAAGSTVYLYRLPGDNPAAWVVPAILKAPDDLVYNTILNPQLTRALDQVALFDTAAPVTAQTLDALPEPLDISARVVDFEPGRIGIELSSPAPAHSALVVSENYYPGWSAEVDGRPAAIGRANLTLIGVPLPPGARRVELSFDSEPYHAGKAITLVTVALALVLAIVGAVADRRSRSEARREARIAGG